MGGIRQKRTYDKEENRIGVINMRNLLLSAFSIVFAAVLFANCSKGLSPEKQALALAQKSYALGNNLSVGLAIDEFVKEGEGRIKPLGWEVSGKGEHLYLVSFKYNIFSFDKGIGERGYFFEVDLRDESVRNVTEEYTEKMEPLSKPFKGEREILEEIIEGSDVSGK